MGDNTRRGRVAFQETHGETHQPGLGEEERGQYGAPDTAEPTNAHTREPSHAEGRRNLIPPRMFNTAAPAGVMRIMSPRPHPRLYSSGHVPSGPHG